MVLLQWDAGRALCVGRGPKGWRKGSINEVIVFSTGIQSAKRVKLQDNDSSFVEMGTKEKEEPVPKN